MDRETAHSAAREIVPPETPLIRPASPHPISGSDEEFQALLLDLARRAASESDAASLIRYFCRATREFFQVSGVYFWRRRNDGEFVGEEADGNLHERFRGMTLKAGQSVVTAEAVRGRRALFVNHVASELFPIAAEFHALSMMAAPLLVLNEVVGAATFIHDANATYFNSDLAAKATILTGQLGSLLEASRLSDVARHEKRRAEILAEVAQVLDNRPDASVVIEALADRVRLLLGARLVCVVLKHEGPYELRAVSAETPQLAHSVRARHDRHTVRFVADVAQQAAIAGGPVLIPISNESHSLGGLVSAGHLLAVPFRTSRTHGVILVYPLADSEFSEDDAALVAAVAGFGGVALANAELFSTARDQAHELHQLLDISSELGSCGDLDQFLQAFVARAADFLGFGRCFIALLEDNRFFARYGVEGGVPRRAELEFPEGLATERLRAKDVFWSDDVTKLKGANLQAAEKFQIRQLLAVPLLGAHGDLLGMFTVLDRNDRTGITQEDVRRARALAAQVAVVLEVTRNLHQSEKHRVRAEALMALTREISGTRRLEELAERTLRSLQGFLGGSQAVFAVFEDGKIRPVTIQGEADSSEENSTQTIVAPQETDYARRHLTPDERLSEAVASLFASKTETVITGKTLDLLGRDLASPSGSDFFACKLINSAGMLSGAVIVAGLHFALTREDIATLQIASGHVSTALESVRLFTQIQQANRHWLDIFDAIADFIVVHDESGKVLRVNRSLANFVGVPPSELSGVSIGAVLGAANKPAPMACPFCRSQQTDFDEFVHRLLDRSYLISTSRVHGTAGEGFQTIHILKDITDRSEAETRYRELFDNIQEALYYSTPDGRFIEINDAAVRMFGYSSREEMLQIDIPSQLFFTQEQRDQQKQLLYEHGSLRDFETTLRRKDGSPIRVLINAFAMYDHTGQIVQHRGLMLDVSGLRESQSDLQWEREFSSKVLSNTQSFILVTDTSGRISYANKRWTDTGFAQKELIGRPVIELAAPASYQAFSEALQATLRGVAVETLELQLLRPKDEVGHFSASLSAMREQGDRITSIVLVMTDITDAVMLRDKLVHTEKMAAVGQLVSGVAHEVNNPLTAILGFADLLMENPDLPPSARKDLRVILQQAQRTKEIVQNLLSFARQTPPQRNLVQVNSILRSTIQLRSYDFGSHSVEVIEHFDEGLPGVLGDAHQLQQVFLNILNNAYDAVRESGPPTRIEIMTTKAGGNVEISFRDSGRGVEHLDRIFDPFFTTKEVGKGTGLGLSICYGIVREHGGEILCHNNVDARGATFIVRLPAAENAALGVAAGVKQP